MSLGAMGRSIANAAINLMTDSNGPAINSTWGTPDAPSSRELNTLGTLSVILVVIGVGCLIGALSSHMGDDWLTKNLCEVICGGSALLSGIALAAMRRDQLNK